MAKHTTENYTLTYDDSQEAKDRAFALLLGFFLKNECFTGESIMQCDAPQIEAPDLLSDVAEKAFGFKCDWNE